MKTESPPPRGDAADRKVPRKRRTPQNRKQNQAQAAEGDRSAKKQKIPAKKTVKRTMQMKMKTIERSQLCSVVTSLELNRSTSASLSPHLQCHCFVTFEIPLTYFDLFPCGLPRYFKKKIS